MSVHWKSLLLQIRRPIIENNRIENSLLLNASGRSGSTWLAEILNYRNDFRVIFEPFHPYRSISLFQGLTQREYLVEQGDKPTLEKGIELVLSGRIRHAWVDHLNRRIRVERRLIKTIRANLMLPFIQRYYPQVKIVFLIRHPLPTVLSRIRMGWKPLLDDFTTQPQFCADFGYLLKNHETRCDSLLEKHLHSWCLEHHVPLKLLRNDNVHVVFYEDLVADPMRTCEELFSFVGLEMDESLSGRLNSPSAMSVHSDKKKNQPEGESIMPPDEVDEILHLYKLDFLYDTSGVPKTRASEVLNGLKA